HEYSSFQDTICRLYDDACFEDFVDFQAERFDLPRALILKLQKFKTALDEYLDRTDTFIDEQDLIKDPAWKGIQLLAQEVITEFKQAGFSS
ncbi:MAG TPA: hypothetical protein VJ112_00285, partial [Rhabdochlamydiaceae bacterium]|nr:hypothetical protein [Rhabdochlamydiaceae bacterium]